MTARSAGGVADLPVDRREDFRPHNREDFVRRIWPHAERAAGRLGTEPKAIVAQAALETGWGQKQIRGRDGVSSNNLFGIKADSRWPGELLAVRTLEYSGDVARSQVDKFRAYADLEQGFEDYVDFLQTNPRYGMSAETRLNADDYVQRLQSAGYATDPRYAEKIQRIMNSDRLEKTIADIKVTANAPTL